MPATIVVNTSISYVNPAAPVGFEVVFAVHDVFAGGGGAIFVSCISVAPVNALYWTLEAVSSTGKRDAVNNYVRDPADWYDPYGITATWTEPISANPADPTRYVLRGRFGAQGGLIQVQTQSVQSDHAQNNGSVAATIPIPAPQGW